MKYAVIAFMVLSAGSAFAHHSATAAYFADKKPTVKGTVVQFLFRNPHSFLQIDAPDDKGRMVRWTVEWAGAGQLGHEGVLKDTLKPGDHVVIVGNLGRNPDTHTLRMIGISRPSDGFQWGGAIH
jgi:hypothetical protein